MIPTDAARNGQPPDLQPEAWMAEGACRGCDPNLWFPERGDNAHTARAICHTCPVEAECGEFALRTHQHYGIWGGLTERERRTIREARYRAGRPARRTA